MRNELTEALLIVQTVILCLVMFLSLNQEKERQEEIKQIHIELQEAKVEIEKAQNELKHNDNIVLKVLEKEW